MAIDEITQRVEELSKRYQAASRKKSELHGQLEAKKAELAALSQEIKAAGYDPRKIKEERDKAEKDLLQDLESCDSELKEVEAALTAFEKK